MSKTIGYALLWLAVIAIIVFGAVWLVKGGSKQNLDEFAQCIEQSGAKFYGAFWCPHCHNQKELFGDSVDYLPYVECSEADGQNQTPICNQVGIESYPSWTFADGFTVTSATEPTACPVQPGPADQPEDCGLGQGQVGSTTFKIWRFKDLFGNKDLIVRSNDEPSHEGDEWTFSSRSFANGELPLEFLAEQTKCTLPTPSN